MGILNVTPDSFSDGGMWESTERAVLRGQAMFDAGADIVDIGGESTRPGSMPLSPSEEIDRVLPVVKALSAVGRVSIDTRNETVALACIDAGATILNDISAGLGHLAGELEIGWIAMHMKGTPQTMQVNPRYEDVTQEVLDFLLRRARHARNSGADNVWIDPGIGFGKTTAHNLRLLRDLKVFTSTEFPVVVGASRKGFIGDVASADNPTKRLGGSIAVAVWAALAGAAIVRVHDVAETVQALRLAAAIQP